MNFNQAKALLQKDISKMTLEQLQKHKVKILDAWRESEAFYGIEKARRNGFYVYLHDASASGFIPRDMWLTQNLKTRYDEVIKAEGRLIHA